MTWYKENNVGTWINLFSEMILIPMLWRVCVSPDGEDKQMKFDVSSPGFITGNIKKKKNVYATILKLQSQKLICWTIILQ
jgi:hypothetical protein